MPKLISNHISVLLLIGIAAAIAMSAIHVGDFLYTTDGPLAILGGAAIAICTISSSYYAFDSTKAGKGWPWAGVVFFGVVSAAMQINHYQLEPTINDITAIAMGMLWPIGEIILGGIMASVRNGERHETDLFSELRSTIDALNTELTDLRQRSTAAAEQMIAEHKAALNNLREQLNEQIAGVIAERNNLYQQLREQSAEQKSLTERLNAITLENARLNATLDTLNSVGTKPASVQPVTPPSAPKRSTANDEADREAQKERCVQFFTEQPGGSQRAAAEHVGCSLGTLNSLANELVEDLRLRKDMNGKYYPAIISTPATATITPNGHHKTGEA